MAEPNPAETVLQITTGHWLPRCLHTIANLGVADALEDQPKAVEELAKAIGADAGALSRVLRLVSSHGIFHSLPDGRYSHNEASRLLRSDHPQSMRAFVQMIGMPLCWTSFGALEHSVRTSQPAANQVAPDGVFQYLVQHPEEARLFNAAMAGKAHRQVAAVVAAYDFSRFKRICDVGGGRGHLLQAVLKVAPNAKGVLFDLQHTIDDASAVGSERLTLQGGDFFKDTLPSCDAYLLMEVLHDWPDAEVTTILKAIRLSASPEAKILVIENSIPNDPGPGWAKALDINMLVITGGRERNKAEFEELFSGTGFKLDRVIDTPVINIVEGTAI